MLRQEITYTDYNVPPQSHTEFFYFNLTELEIAKMESMPAGGLGAVLERIAEAKNINQMIGHLEDIVLGAVGVRSDDGKQFIKVQPDGRLVRDWFQQHAAYAELFKKMWSDDRFLVSWMAGTFPSEYAPKVHEAAAEARERLGVPDADRNPDSGITGARDASITVPMPPSTPTA